MPVPTVRPAKRQHGAAMVEFAVAALPLLFCTLFVVEAVRWHMTRQMLNLALLEAARAGAVAHARPAVMERAFERALLPLFQPPGRHGSPQARMRAAFLDVARQTGVLAWNIDVVSPSARVYADFGDASLRVADAPGLPAIRNDYQAEQHARRRRMGWSEGRGPSSGATIFEANTLRLRLRYIHPPLVPGVRGVLRQLAAMHGWRDPATSAGMLVIAMELALPMQSHPVQWQANTETARETMDYPPVGRRTRMRGATAPQESGVADTRQAMARKRETVDRNGSVEPNLAADFKEVVTGNKAAKGGDAIHENDIPDRNSLVDVNETADRNGLIDENEAAACGVVLCCVSGASAGTRLLSRSPR